MRRTGQLQKLFPEALQYANALLTDFGKLYWGEIAYRKISEADGQAADNDTIFPSSLKPTKPLAGRKQAF